MSDESSSDDDIFGGGSESDDTNELIASATAASSSKKKKMSSSSSSSSPVKKRKSIGGGRLKKKSKYPDADNNNDDSDDDSDDEAKGLFDSDDDDDDNNNNVEEESPSKILSKRERMEALQAKKRAAIAATTTKTTSSTSSKRNKKQRRNEESNDIIDNDDDDESVDSANYIRTKEDDDFIDTQGEDEDLVREYYAEQHFDDDDDLKDMEVNEKGGGKGKKRKYSSGGSKRGPDSLSAEDKKDKDNPILIAVERMKKKKQITERYEELQHRAMDLIQRMEQAAVDDELSIRNKKPGLEKLKLLPNVLEQMIKREMIRPLLESDFLVIAKKWIEPSENGTLGNVTLRERIIDGISKMNGETGIDNDDLKRSDFGKLVMMLYMHKKETPEMKRKLKALIEQWSRRIFKKTGDLKHLGASQASRRSDAGLVGIHKQQSAMAAGTAKDRSDKNDIDNDSNKDLGSILANGVKQARDLGRNRVRVPYSKGFQFTVQPESKTGDVADKKTRISSVNDQRESLHKRMLEKKKKISKNARSANISIEGRPTK